MQIAFFGTAIQFYLQSEGLNNDWTESPECPGSAGIKGVITVERPLLRPVGFGLKKKTSIQSSKPLKFKSLR